MTVAGPRVRDIYFLVAQCVLGKYKKRRPPRFIFWIYDNIALVMLPAIYVLVAL
jgi:hypothetical protein